MVNNLSPKWRDFVVFPLDPDRVTTREQRFDLSAAQATGKLVTESVVVWPGDAFEALRVDELGNVTIWTRKRAWFLRREHGMEKLLYVMRNPHEEPDRGE